MHNRLLIIAVMLALLIPFWQSSVGSQVQQRLFGSRANIVEVRERVLPKLIKALKARNLELGDRIFIRVFKQERLLEVWLQSADAYELFKTYDICNYSGGLGPKLKEGDRQSPEGFYSVSKRAMNPNSRYHLSFNLGFPNTYDQAHGRTGSFLMIHGSCVSIGCYAMTNPSIEEVYLMIEAAHDNGQTETPVHIFPFRMTADRLSEERNHEWFVFWQNLKSGYDVFERDFTPPRVTVSGRSYVFEAALNEPSASH